MPSPSEAWPSTGAGGEAGQVCERADAGSMPDTGHRAKIEALLNQLPATPGGRSLIPSFAGLLDTIIGQTNDYHHPLNWKTSEYGRARKELLKIAEAIDRLSPVAKLGLTSGPMRHPHRLAAVFRLAADEVVSGASGAPVEAQAAADTYSPDDYAPAPLPPAEWLAAQRDLRSAHIERVRSGQAKGRGPDAWAELVADNAADAYAFITETNPPVEDYYGKPGCDHPFLDLVANLFRLGKLKASAQNQARRAAERLALRVERKAPK